MICLRLWRSLLPGLTRGAASLGAAARPSAPISCVLLLGLLAASGPYAPIATAATRSRARHITPALTPLHYTERSFSTSHHGKPGSKSAAKHSGTAPAVKQKAHASAPGTHPAARHGKQHHPDADYDAPIPMLRASHGKSHGSGELAFTKTHSHLEAPHPNARPSTRQGRRLPLPAPDPAEAQDTVVAEVTGRSPHGDTLARLHNRAAVSPGAQPSAAVYGSSPVIVASAPGSATSGRAAKTLAAPIERHPPSPAASPYAYGTAQPDELDRSIASLAPRTPPAASRPMVTAQAPSQNGRPGPVVPPTQVVDGFGSELALAPALPSDHPGLTRRRNHPIPASALSEDARSSAPVVLAANLPSTLAERDAITAGAMTPSILSSNLPNIYDDAGHLVVPAPLRGSREVLIHQNTMADNDGLERIENDAQLNRLRATGQLIDLPAGPGLRVNDNLPLNRRSARPWTALFTQDIARDYYARFHQPLWVTSAVRTVAFQSRLIRVNGNAAGLSGDFASPHLTGQAVDFGKRGMTAAQLAWMRSYLLPLIQSGKIDVEEEFQQACFHISVYRRYAGGRHVVSPTMQVASQAPTPAYVPAQPPRPANPRPITPLTNPEITDTDK